MSLLQSSMARLVVKDNITSGGALVVGQTLRLGGFVMTARSAVAPTMTSQVIKNSLHVNSELAEQMDPMELASLRASLAAPPGRPPQAIFSRRRRKTAPTSIQNLLDRWTQCIAALGVATDYDRIGLKPDQRDIKSPSATHEIAVVEKPHTDYPSILRTNYVRITDLPEPDTPQG